MQSASRDTRRGSSTRLNRIGYDAGSTPGCSLGVWWRNDWNSFMTRTSSVLSWVAFSRLIAMGSPQSQGICLLHTNITLPAPTEHPRGTVSAPEGDRNGAGAVFGRGGGQWVTTRASRTRRAIASSPSTLYAVSLTERRPAARRVNASVDTLIVVAPSGSASPAGIA